jgi:hypothetical protein
LQAAFLLIFVMFEVFALQFLRKSFNWGVFKVWSMNLKPILMEICVIIILSCDIIWVFTHRKLSILSYSVSVCKSVSFATTVIVVMVMDGTPSVSRKVCAALICGVTFLCGCNLYSSLVVWDRFVLLHIGAEEFTMNDIYQSAYQQLIIVLVASLAIVLDDIRHQHQRSPALLTADEWEFACHNRPPLCPWYWSSYLVQEKVQREKQVARNKPVAESHSTSSAVLNGNSDEYASGQQAHPPSSQSFMQSPDFSSFSDHYRFYSSGSCN